MTGEPFDTQWSECISYGNKLLFIVCFFTNSSVMTSLKI